MRMQPNALLHRMNTALAPILADIETLVRYESPSADRSAVAGSAELLARLGTERLGVAPERIVEDGFTHLRWRFGTGPTRVLLLGHHDTVWPLGSLATHPFGIEDGIMRGPGCLDMKAGVVMAMYAIAGLADPAGVTLLITGDEEIGSPSSRALIEADAAGCHAALVLESGADDGSVKTERKGTSMYEIRVVGRAAHAGLEPERGINATIELAHLVLAVEALADPARGTTITPTLLSAGTTSNTVPAFGSVTLDVRVREVEEQNRVHAALLALRPILPGARLEVLGGANRPPLSAALSAGLFERAQRQAAALGLAPLTGVAVGGASDGNFTAGIGVPTLDGLGAVGGGAHADHEHLRVADLAPRTAVLTALIVELLADTPDTSGATAVGNSGNSAS
jgi:glutamate carboxypeptidase